MALRKRTNLISIILAMLAVASLICVSMITTVAETEPTVTYEYIVENYGDYVNASGLIKENSLVEGENFSSFITNPIEELRIEQANEIVRLAEMRVKFEDDFSNEEAEKSFEVLLQILPNRITSSVTP